MSIFKLKLMKSTLYKGCLLIISAVVCSSCVSDDVAAPQLVCLQPDLLANKKVSEIRAITNDVVTQYKFDDIIEAYVVSSDEGGNFFKSISFQTLATATTPAIGFSVPVDATNLYIDFRIGNKVYIKLKNQYTDLSFGGMRIGNIFVNSSNQGGVGRLSQNDYKKILNASCTTLKEEDLVRSLTMSELLNDSNLNTLVELSNVQFSEEAIGRRYFEEVNNTGGATNWGLIDKSGNQIYFRTSSFSDFATKIVPDGSGKVRGVLTKFGHDYQLLPRSEKDVTMTVKRAIPFFSQDFKTVVDRSNVSLAGWANIVQSGSIAWRGGAYAGNSYAEFYISGTRVLTNVAWLISPKINMDVHTKEILTFRAAQNGLDVDSPLNALEVYVSTNFNGLNITAATWTRLAVNLPNQATPDNQFIGSGAVDLSSYTGSINIAFKYIGSGRNRALDGGFQIDDVQIFGDK
jgi:hypothetical protein